MRLSEFKEKLFSFVDDESFDCYELNILREKNELNLVKEKIEEFIEEGYLEYTREYTLVRLFDIYESCELAEGDKLTHEKIVVKATIGVCMKAFRDLRGKTLDPINVGEFLEKNFSAECPLPVPGFRIEYKEEHSV